MIGNLVEGVATRAVRPELRALVAQASQALARLDAPRLEELAHSCAALNRELPPLSRMERERLAREAREAAGEMAVFARVLDATRSNLRVINRLRDLRMGRIEYSDGPAIGGDACGSGSGNGND